MFDVTFTISSSVLLYFCAFQPSAAPADVRSGDGSGEWVAKGGPPVKYETPESFQQDRPPAVQETLDVESLNNNKELQRGFGVVASQYVATLPPRPGRTYSSEDYLGLLDYALQFQEGKPEGQAYLQQPGKRQEPQPSPLQPPVISYPPPSSPPYPQPSPPPPRKPFRPLFLSTRPASPPPPANDYPPPDTSDYDSAGGSNEPQTLTSGSDRIWGQSEPTFPSSDYSSTGYIPPSSSSYGGSAWSPPPSPSPFASTDDGYVTSGVTRDTPVAGLTLHEYNNVITLFLAHVPIMDRFVGHVWSDYLAAHQFAQKVGKNPYLKASLHQVYGV